MKMKCNWCGALYDGNSRSRYCSRSCKQRRYAGSKNKNPPSTERKKLCGVGINDANYHVTKKVDGKVMYCPYYRAWSNMINRCYAPSFKKAKPSYDGDTVCREWLVFSKFREWMHQQDWQGCDLDKDLIDNGNTVYSPEKCEFIPSELNKFIASGCNSSKKETLGITRHGKGFRANASNMITKKSEHLGMFKTEREAKEAWVKRKIEIAKLMKEMGIIKKERHLQLTIEMYSRQL